MISASAKSCRPCSAWCAATSCNRSASAFLRRISFLAQANQTNHSHAHTHTHTHLISHEDMICICLCFYKARLKWLFMTCHKSCFSRHVKKECLRNLYSVKSSHGTEPRKRKFGSTKLKSIEKLQNTEMMHWLWSRTAGLTRKTKRQNTNIVSSPWKLCRYVTDVLPIHE